MGTIHATVANSTAIVSGSNTIGYQFKLELDKTVKLYRIMSFAEIDGNSGGQVSLYIKSSIQLANF